MTVYVCAQKDIVCGDRPDRWCDSCPRRSASMSAARIDAVIDQKFGSIPGALKAAYREFAYAVLKEAGK